MILVYFLTGYLFLCLNIIFGLGLFVCSFYMSLCLYGGVGVVESYIERVSRSNGFEYGHVRLFGSIAGATASFVGGILFYKIQKVFWAASISGAILCVLLYLAPVKKDVMKTKTNNAVITKNDVFKIFKIKRFWFCVNNCWNSGNIRCV